MLIEKPSSGNTMNVPIERHRHREQRDEGRAPVLEEDEDDEDDQHTASKSVWTISVDARGDRRGRVERHLLLDVRREARLAAPPSLARRRFATSSAFEPGIW